MNISGSQASKILALLRVLANQKPETDVYKLECLERL